MKSILNLLCVSLIFFSQSIFASAEPIWDIEKIDRAAPGNRVVQLSLSKEGKKHLVYTGCTDSACSLNELFYSVLSPNNNWEKVSVDSKGDDTGWFPSITFDSNSKAHIFYADHEDQTLRYATFSNTRWNKQDLGKGRGGWWTSSASANNKVYFAHTKLPKTGWENAALEVGTLENNEWKFEVVDATRNAGWFTTMATLPDGNPVVSYSSIFSQPLGTVKIAIKNSNAWSTVDIDNNSIKHHVAVDGFGKIHLIYQKSISGPTAEQPNGINNLMYATNSSGSWKRSKIAPANDDETDTGYFPRLKIDSKGRLHAVFANKRNQLVYARKIDSTSNWEFHIVDDLEGVIYPWIEIGANENIEIAFERGGNIYLATCTVCAK